MTKQEIMVEIVVIVAKREDVNAPDTFLYDIAFSYHDQFGTWQDLEYFAQETPAWELLLEKSKLVFKSSQQRYFNGHDANMVFQFGKTYYVKVGF